MRPAGGGRAAYDGRMNTTATPFRIRGLPAAPFAHLYGLPDEALRERGVVRYVADHKPGFPDRIALRDAEPGESVLLVNHVHHDVANPYRASHAVFVIEGEQVCFDNVGEVPACLRPRLLSVRAFDADGMMVDAEVIDGSALEGAIARFFADPQVRMLHLHYAKRGCYAACVLRA